jgi:hypothetical protein
MIMLFSDDEARAAAELANAGIRAERIWCGDADSPTLFLLRSDDLESVRASLAAARLPTHSEAA